MAPLVVTALLEPFQGEGRARTAAAAPLQASAVGAFDQDRSIQGEASSGGAESAPSIWYAALSPSLRDFLEQYELVRARVSAKSRGLEHRSGPSPTCGRRAPSGASSALTTLTKRIVCVPEVAHDD
jgi:hypothetical protein